MIRLTTTPLHKGVVLSGDYDDLYELRQSISRYLDLYEDNCEFSPFGENGLEYLLSLNYDLRHAYMGTREVIGEDSHLHDLFLYNGMDDPADAERNSGNGSSQAVDWGDEPSLDEVPDWDPDWGDEPGGNSEESGRNTVPQKDPARELLETYGRKNLHFGVKILYPLLFHYLAAFTVILSEGYEKEWFTNPNNRHPCTRLQADYDRAQIALFVEMIWQNLAELLGEQVADDLHSLSDDVEYILPQTPEYVDYLLQHFLSAAICMSQEDIHSLLILDLYALLDIELDELLPDLAREARIIGYYTAARDAVTPKLRHPLLTVEELNARLEKHFRHRQPVGMDEFEKYLNYLCGKADWDQEI